MKLNKIKWSDFPTIKIGYTGNKTIYYHIFCENRIFVGSIKTALFATRERVEICRSKNLDIVKKTCQKHLDANIKKLIEE